MKPLTILVTIFIVLIGLVGGVVLAAWGGWIPLGQPFKRSPGPVGRVPDGPHATIVCDEPSFDFGSMAVDEEKNHEFVVRNDGDVTLLIGKVKISCKCTKAQWGKKKLEPGESTTVNVFWKPIAKSATFRQSVSITSNDPEHPEYSLYVKGAVRSLVSISPPKRWTLGTLSAESPTTIEGTVQSDIVDHFEILSIDCDNELVSAEWTLMPEEKIKAANLKCGYDVRITVPPGAPIGRLRELLTLRTDINGSTNIVWQLAGNRIGPVQFYPTGNVKWISEEMTISLRTFEARKGQKAQLMMMVTGLEDGQEFELLDAKSCSEHIQVSIEPGAALKSAKKKQYYLAFKIPADAPPLNITRDKGCTVSVKTNHPQAEEIEFTIEFTSY